MGNLLASETIYRALEQVFDACSVLNDTRLNVVEMGLIRDIEREGEDVHVRLLLTDPFCPYFFELTHRMEQVLMTLPGVRNVRFEACDDEVWTPERMAPAARERLAQHRAVRFAQLQSRPPPLQR